MADHECVNCARPATESHDLLIRSSRHESVWLCDECYEAIQDELEEAA